MRIAPKRFIMAGPSANYPALSPQPPECSKVYSQYGVGSFKYVIICDPHTLDHVARRMRIAAKLLYNREALSKLPLIVTAAP